jgi:hypothetical protein
MTKTTAPATRYEPILGLDVAFASDNLMALATSCYGEKGRLSTIKFIRTVRTMTGGIDNYSRAAGIVDQIEADNHPHSRWERYHA